MQQLYKGNNSRTVSHWLPKFEICLLDFFRNILYEFHDNLHDASLSRCAGTKIRRTEGPTEGRPRVHLMSPLPKAEGGGTA